MLRRFRARPKYLALIFYRTPLNGVRRCYVCVSCNDICILSGVRTPIGSFQGSLASLTAVELGSTALIAAVERSGIERNEVEELVLGTAFPAGCGQGTSYHVAVSSGMSDSIIQSTVSKFCASGMKAIMNGCNLIATNSQDVVAVGGVDSLTHSPYFLKRRQTRLGHLQMIDPIFHDVLVDSYDHVHVISLAEKTIKEYKYTKEHLDSYALMSYLKAAKAQDEQAFKQEMVPISIIRKEGCEEIVCHDEEVRKLDLDEIPNQKPFFGNDGTITPGNSSALADGAAVLILASGDYVLRKNLRPLAKIISFADAALNRKHIVLATAVAARKALLKANKGLSDIKLWEIGETFPINVPLSTKILEIDENAVNVHGGSISLGHPVGMTGARLVVHLAHALSPGMLGCASISHPTGGASAMIIQKL